MGTLRFYSIILKKFNNPSTFPFNILSYIQGDMITFNNLSDRTKSDRTNAKTYYFILWFFLKIILKIVYHAFLIKND